MVCYGISGVVNREKCDVTLHMVALFLDDNKTNDDGDGNENGKT